MDTNVLIGIGLLLLGLTAWLAPKIYKVYQEESEEKDSSDPDCNHTDSCDLFYHFDQVRELAPEDCYQPLTDMMPKIFAEKPEEVKNE